MPETALFHPAPHLGALQLEGADCAVFLQGQLTCDVLALTAGRSCFGAICTVQGRVIGVLLLIRRDNGFYLIAPLSVLDKLARQLQKYVLRAKVAIKPAESCQVYGVSGVRAALEYFAPHPLSPGHGWLVSESELPASGAAERWRAFEIHSGVPWLDANCSERFTPQMLRLDELGGLSFSKGCYTGQEIIARTHFLGAAKRKLFHAVCAPLDVKSGASVVTANGDAAGEVAAALTLPEQTLLQIVILADAADGALTLDDSAGSAITIKEYQLHFE